MDVFQTVSGYITKMVTAGDGQNGSNASKMKILLLDSETVCHSPLSELRIYTDQVRFLSSPQRQHNPPSSITKYTSPSTNCELPCFDRLGLTIL